MGTTAKKSVVVALALAVLALGLTALTQVAGATHPRPVGASPIRASLVPAYEACAASNRTHGPPLSFPSCNPPGQTSSSLTVGTPDANGAGANSSAFVNLRAIVDAPGPPEGSDIVFRAQITDVRCKPGTTACGNANTAGGPDYTGELKSDATVRLTDHFNAIAPGGGPDPATVNDFPFPVPLSCANTAATSIGGTCAVDTTFEALSPGSVTKMEGKRSVVELAQFQVFDGGADGFVSTTPNTLFAVQGIFIP